MSANGFTSTDYLQILDSANLTQFTLAARVKLAGTGNQSILHRTDSAVTVSYSHTLRVNSGVWNAYVFGASPDADAGAAASTAWQTIVAVCNQGVGIEVFVGGVSAGATAVTGTFWTGGDRWVVGHGAYSWPTTGGKIAWAGLWPRLATAKEIESLNTFNPALLPGARWIADFMGSAWRVHSSANLVASMVGSAATMNKENPRILG